MNLLEIKNYSVITYKNDLTDFFQKVKKLFEEIEKINQSSHILNNISAKDINNEVDLKNNKLAMDMINSTFKPLIIINDDIKKTLNNWKSNFAGNNGLDTLIESIKNQLLSPLKQKQIEYDQRIKTTTLKEQAETKTTIGLREYKKIVFDEVIPLDVPIKYWLLNESLVKEDIKKNPNIKIKGIKYHIEVELK